MYSGVHKRSDAYSSLLSKPQLLSMTWRTFKILLPAWQSGSKQILIGDFQKGRTCSCISRDTKVAGCQTFFIFLFMYHIVIAYENTATYEHFWFFQVLKLWQPVTLQPLEAQGHVLPFWKPPIKICLEPACQVGSSILKVRQAMLKSWGLLNKQLYASDLLCTPL